MHFAKLDCQRRVRAAATSYVWITAAALACAMIGAPPAAGFGLKSDICGSWNNYCRGGTLPAPSTPRSNSAPTSGGSTYDPTTRGWYCKAVSRNRAWGWGKYTNQAAAANRAIHECENNARGQSCSIQVCRLEGPGGTASGSPSSNAPTAQKEEPLTQFRPAGARCGGKLCLHDQVCGPNNQCYNPQLTFYCGETRCVKDRVYKPGSACGACTTAGSTAAQGPASASPRLLPAFRPLTCDECYRKLKGAIRRGWATGLPRTYIATSIAGYQNCKLQIKDASSCTTGGDIFARGLPACANPSFNDAGSRQCIKSALISDPSQY